MAKDIPAEADLYTLLDYEEDEFALASDRALFDASDGKGWVKLRQGQGWMLGYRMKHHASDRWDAGVLRSVAGAFEDRLDYRIAPRHHVPRLLIRVNADTDGDTGQIRVTTPAGAVTFTFNAAFGAVTEQSNTVLCTNTAPPTRQLVTVAMRIGGTSTRVDLRRLLIRDDKYSGIVDLP